MKKRWIALLLCISYIISLFCMSAIASEEKNDTVVQDQQMQQKQKSIVLATDEPHVHPLCGDGSCAEHDDLTWTKWTSSTALPTSTGNYYLESDVSLSSALTLSTAVNIRLCLNGHDISVKNSGQRAIRLSGGAKMTICDCTADGEGETYAAGIISGAATGPAVGGIIYLSDANTTLDFYNGILTDGKATGSDANVFGGAIYSQKSSTVNFYNGRIFHCSAKNGGALAAYSEGIINLYGGIFDLNTASNGGGVVYSSSNSKLHAENAVFSDNIANLGGVLWTNTPAELIGCTFSGNNAKSTNGGALCFAGGNQTITECIFENNTAKTNGGAIYADVKSADYSVTCTDCSFIQNSAVDGGAIEAKRQDDSTTKKLKLVIRGGSFTENQASNGGGAIHVLSTASLEANDVQFDANKASLGGVLWTNQASTFTNCSFTGNEAIKNGGALCFGGSQQTIQNCDFSENIAGINGGAICAEKATLILDGGSITENQAESFGGGVYSNGQSTTSQLCGNIVIKENKVQGVSSNLFLADDKPVDVSKLGDESIICISAKSSGTKTVATGASKDYSANFFAENSYQEIVYQSGKMVVQNVEHQHCVCAEPGCKDHALQSFEPWISTTTLPKTSGNYFLTADVTLSTATAVSSAQNICLCLNGHTIEVTGAGQRAYRLSGGAKLTICDCQAKEDDLYSAGSISCKNITGPSVGAILYITDAGSELNVYDGILTGGTTAESGSSYGGGIYAQQNASVNIYGGMIEKCASVNGGAVALLSGATLNFCGGRLSDNHATADGGAIAATTSSKINVSGGLIEKNSADRTGGAINASASTLTINGGKICRNTAANGGAICLVTASTMQMTDGEISSNEAKETAGAVYISYGGVQAEILGGKLNLNRAGANGGAIALSKKIGVNDSSLLVKNASLNSNYAAGEGGALYTNGCKILLEKAAFSENHAVKNGGAIAAGGNSGQNVSSELTLKECEFRGNIADKAGGAIIITSANTTLKSVGNIFEKNKAKEDGGVIYASYGTFVELENDTLEANEAKRGGSIFVGHQAQMQKTKLLLNGVKILKNKAVNSGGGIYLNDCDPVFNRTKISENSAEYGGGIYIYEADLILDGGLNVENNSASGGGGGIAVSESTASGITTTLTVRDVLISGNKAKDGAGIELLRDCSLNFLGGTVSNNAATEDGGGIYLFMNGTMNVSGGIISGNSAVRNGGGVYVNTGKLNLTGSSIKNNKAENQGGGIYARVAQVTLTGGEIFGNTANDGGGLVSRVSTVSFDGLKVYQNHALATGGGIQLGENTKFTMLSGEIFANKSDTECGGLLAVSNSQVELKNGKIYENTCRGSGGGVYVNNGKLTISGGSIYRNHAGTEAGGVQARSSVVDVTNADIYENVADKNGGGFAIGSNTVMTLHSGKIYKNTAGENGGGFLEQSGSSLTVLNGEFTKNQAQKANGGAGYVSKTTTFTLQNGTFEENTAKSDAGAIYFLNCTAELNGGTITKNHANRFGGALTGTGAVLRLNGVTLSSNTSTKEGGAAYLSSSEISMDGTKVVDNQSDASGGGLVVRAESSFTLKSGSMTGNKALHGGALLVMSKSVLNLNGGTICENTADGSGGGVYMSRDTTLRMRGGIISKNYAAEKDGKGGGGIYASQCDVKISGGTVSDNVSAKQGGGLFIEESEVQLGKFAVTGNTANGDGGGGGMVLRAKTNATIDGTNISQNTAKNGGAMIILTQSKIIVNSATIAENTASMCGGGIYLSGNNECMLLRGGTIENNFSKSAGAGIYLASDCTMTGGSICGNRAGKASEGDSSDNPQGGAVYIAKRSSFTMTGGEISGNQAMRDGGAVSAAWLSTFSFNGGKLHDNLSNAAGGAIAAYGANINMENGELFGHKSGSYGGAISLTNHSVLTMKNMKIHDNEAQIAGAIRTTSECEIYADCCDFTKNSGNASTGAILSLGKTVLTDCTVTDNSSGKHGAIYANIEGYDGKSYVPGLLVLAGKCVIFDNQGEDLYLDYMTPVMIEKAGLKDGSKIGVKLQTGQICRAVSGAYDYKKTGSHEYVLTAGTGSLDKPEKYDASQYEVPEKDPPLDELIDPNQTVFGDETDASLPTSWIFGLVGAIVVIAAAVLIVILKKKKAKSAKQQ